MSDNNAIIHRILEEGYDFFITDKWNKKLHFKIATFVVPTGLLSEAYEVIDDKQDNVPRIFHVLSDFNSDKEKSELQLKEKIKKGINKRSLDYKNGNYMIGNDLKVEGRILWDDKLINSEFEYFFRN